MCPLIPHRLSSSPDWRPAASLFVPASSAQGKRAPAISDKSIMRPACPSPRLVDLDAYDPPAATPLSAFPGDLVQNSFHDFYWPRIYRTTP
jgi:hypothetical protein